MKNKLLLIVLSVIVAIGVASGWVYNALVSNPMSLSKDEVTNMQISFMKNYGTDSTITEGIVPKLYEIAWTDKEGNGNISVNIGGIWVLIASVPKTK